MHKRIQFQTTGLLADQHSIWNLINNRLSMSLQSHQLQSYFRIARPTGGSKLTAALTAAVLLRSSTPECLPQQQHDDVSCGTATSSSSDHCSWACRMLHAADLDSARYPFARALLACTAKLPLTSAYRWCVGLGGLGGAQLGIAAYAKLIKKVINSI